MNITNNKTKTVVLHFKKSKFETSHLHTVSIQSFYLVLCKSNLAAVAASSLGEVSTRFVHLGSFSHSSWPILSSYIGLNAL